MNALEERSMVMKPSDLYVNISSRVNGTNTLTLIFAWSSSMSLLYAAYDILHKLADSGAAALQRVEPSFFKLLITTVSGNTESSSKIVNNAALIVLLGFAICGIEAGIEAIKSRSKKAQAGSKTFAPFHSIVFPLNLCFLISIFVTSRTLLKQLTDVFIEIAKYGYAITIESDDSFELFIMIHQETIQIINTPAILALCAIGMNALVFLTVLTIYEIEDRKKPQAERRFQW